MEGSSWRRIRKEGKKGRMEDQNMENVEKERREGERKGGKER